MLREQGATVQRATAHDDKWELRVLFPEQNRISATNPYAQEHGFSLNVARIYDVDSAKRVRFELTADRMITRIKRLFIPNYMFFILYLM